MRPLEMAGEAVIASSNLFRANNSKLRPAWITETVPRSRYVQYTLPSAYTGEARWRPLTNLSV